MRIEGARALVMRLIVGELLARQGEGPLARRTQRRPPPAREVGVALTSAHEPGEPGEPGERAP